MRVGLHGLEAWSARARPLVLGHRGARRRAPENTLAAFELALDEGADGVELDLRLDGSGEVVVLHDRTLAAATRGADPRDVERLKSHELASIRADGEPIPTLRDVLRWASGCRARLNLELKDDVGDRRALLLATASVLRDAPSVYGRVLISSFGARTVARAAQHLPWVPTCLLLHRLAGAPLAPRPRWLRTPSLRPFERLGAVGVHAEDVQVAHSTVGLLRVRGAALVNVWTVNDPGRARELARWGVDGVITDDPRAVAVALGR